MATTRQLSYNATRRRLRRARGVAARQLCKCGAQAAHWVYDGTDAEHLIGETSQGVLAAYSLDFTRYLPMCRSCHVRASGSRKARALEHEVSVLRAALWLMALSRDPRVSGGEHHAAQVTYPAIRRPNCSNGEVNGR